MEKSAEAFRTISEVSELLKTPAHVLRFWESRFTQVKPVKRAGGRRYYRPSDLALLGGIKRLLHDDGMTIRGVQKVLRERGVRHVAEMSPIDLGAEPLPDEEASPSAVQQETAPRPLKSRVVERAPAPAPAESNVTPLWAATPSPDAAEADDGLLPDPDDLSTPITDEAADAGSSSAFADAPTEADSTPRKPPPVPAATLLRAMDALRAHDKRSDLTSVYHRLSRLRDRVAESDGGGSG